jgi:hypothetical protein
VAVPGVQVLKNGVGPFGKLRAGYRTSGVGKRKSERRGLKSEVGF